MTTRPALHPAKKLLAAIAISFMGATAMSGAAAATTSSAHGHSTNVVHATKEWKTNGDSSLIAPATKEW
jgi:hypothetical protein